MLSADEVVRFLAGDGGSALTQFVSQQRWFAAKTRGIARLRVEDWAVLRPSPALALLLIDVDGDRYYVPVSGAPAGPNPPARLITTFHQHAISDAHWDPAFGHSMLSRIAAGGKLQGAVGRFVFRPMAPWTGPSVDTLVEMRVEPLQGEQSNTSIRFDRALILKSFRRPQI